jgi:copper chaperone CopZ
MGYGINVQKAEANMTDTLTLTVEGMKCGGCEANITNKLKSLTGIDSVTASRLTKEVKVEYDGKLTGRNEISQAITDAGFQVID